MNAPQINMYAKELWFTDNTGKLKAHCVSKERFYGCSIRPVINK